MKKLSYINAINEALSEEMGRDEKVFMVGESIRESAFGASKGLVNTFGPDRIMDTPISETAIAGIALGSAQQGYRPIADFMFADFMYVAMDEIVDNLVGRVLARIGIENDQYFKWKESEKS